MRGLENRIKAKGKGADAEEAIEPLRLALSRAKGGKVDSAVIARGAARLKDLEREAARHALLTLVNQEIADPDELRRAVVRAEKHEVDGKVLKKARDKLATDAFNFGSYPCASHHPSPRARALWWSLALPTPTHDGHSPGLACGIASHSVSFRVCVRVWCPAPPPQAASRCGRGT